MTTYRSLQTIEAVQYQGEPIPGVTCSGEGEDRKRYGCEGLADVPHVHTPAMGGATRLSVGDWIFPAPKGGPFDVVTEAKFRAYWEVPVEGSNGIIESLNVIDALIATAEAESAPPITDQMIVIEPDQETR